tara:strand:+ start:564 stop:848 length:285 start_codon:yes stop_codon:yes gene_type:complete
MKKKGYAMGGMKKKGYAKGGLKMVKNKKGDKVPFYAADGKGKMNNGGMMKKKKGYAKGGAMMPKKKAFAKGGKVMTFNVGGMVKKSVDNLNKKK